MFRALALLAFLSLSASAFATEPPPPASLASLPLAASFVGPAPLVCRSTAETVSCGPVQLAAASCSQTCYEDQGACHQGCDKAYRSGADHDKCMAACTTTYGRCSTRCNGR